ncbi:competence protein CoiA family protein [Streptomyces sp. HD1123-B1]|uniref:competence protein CoiA n=1 Tax=Streptomyces huangiella TaxID=3228804 RepID=UPI003D7D8A9A
MGFTAQHDDRGRLDATQPDLGCGWAWESVHRVRPRVAMTCPECAHPLHAKVSRHGLRFFAHDPGSPTCALAGESMEHHLLKLELATAIRAAGHHAELEVRGPDGDWRADVMASSPDGAVRTTWEAQLSPITADEIRERTARFTKDGVRACWVATKLRPWVGEVPSIHVRPPDDDQPQWTVVGGLARFTIEEPDPRLNQTIGRGGWEETTTDLRSFVVWTLTGRLVPHRLGRYIDEHYWEGMWTAPQYIDAATAYSKAKEKSRAEWEQEQRRKEIERQRHEAQMRAELARPTPTVPHQHPPRAASDAELEWEVDLPREERERLHAATLAKAHVLYNIRGILRHTDGNRRWAMGTPLYAGNRPYGVLRPRPQFIDWNLLKGLVIFVRNYDELRMLGKTAPDGTHIIVIFPDGQPPSD